MKKYLMATLLGIAALPGVSTAQVFVGAGLGSMSVSFDNVQVEKAPTNASVTLGYQFETFAPRLAVELNMTRSLTSGTAAGGDLDVDSMGMYLAFRTSNQLYFKGRVGLMNASISGNLAEDENGETYGAGLGWRMNNINLEFEYTSVDDDISFLSVGVLYQIF